MTSTSNNLPQDESADKKTLAGVANSMSKVEPLPPELYNAEAISGKQHLGTF